MRLFKHGPRPISGHDTAQVLERLAASAGVRARLDGDCALFLLSPDTRFEDLDYLWGSLFDLPRLKIPSTPSVSESRDRGRAFSSL